MKSKFIAAGFGALAFVSASPTLAQPEELGPAITSRHQVQLAGKLLDYTVEVGRIAIRDVSSDEPHGYMFYVAYRMPQSGKPRPLTFLWGGGPGGTAVNMDVEIAGPMRATGDRRLGNSLVANEDTWLPDTDLVFVDAVGTGYSRAAKTEYYSEFMNTKGDTASFAEFIRAWRIQHDAMDAPVYIGGQSWGAPRAATVAHTLVQNGIPLRGVVMITGETSLNKPYLSPLEFEAYRVVGMAGVAFQHKRLARDVGMDLASVSKSADAWVRKIYVPALEKRDVLTEGQRAEIIKGLERYTGVAAALVDQKSLVITPQQFRAGLLKSQEKVLYGSDTRLTQPLKSTYEPAYLRMLRTDFGYRTDAPYITMTARVPGAQIGAAEIGYAPFSRYPVSPMLAWDYRTSEVPKEEADALLKAAANYGGGPPTIGTPLPATEEAVALDPGLRFLIILGRYDGSSTCSSNEILETRLPQQLRSAMTFKCYDSGHSPSRTPGVPSQLHHDVAAMIGRTQSR